MSSVPQLLDRFTAVLGDAATTAAIPAQFQQRRSKVSAAIFVQTLVLGWLAHPRGSLQQLCQTARLLGVPLSPQGLDQRFGAAGAALLEAVFAVAVQQLVVADPVMLPVLDRFAQVLLLDSTTITLPNALATRWRSCDGRTPTTPTAAVKATVRLDLRTGRLDGPLLSAGRDQDQTSPLQHAPVAAGTVRIADLGYWNLGVLASLGAQAAYFLSRLDVQTIVFDGATGARIDVVGWLRAQRGPQGERAVMLGVKDQLPARLLAVRLPPQAAEQRRQTIRATATREGRTPSKALLARADWRLVVTNVPADLLSLAEAMALLRARWQIELLFKLWKSHGALDDWRSHKPHRIACEFFAKLIALLLQHWLILSGGWAQAERSLVRLAATIRDFALLLALTFPHPARFRDTLTLLLAQLAASRPIDRRQRAPNSAQRIAASVSVA
jgi:hypothetical protein